MPAHDCENRLAQDSVTNFFNFLLWLISRHLISRNQILGLAAHHDRWPWKGRGNFGMLWNLSLRLTLYWNSHQSHRIWTQISAGIGLASNIVNVGGWRWTKVNSDRQTKSLWKGEGRVILLSNELPVVGRFWNPQVYKNWTCIRFHYLVSSLSKSSKENWK